MGKPTGFMEIARKTDSELDPIERLKNWKEFKIHGDDKERRAQGARCMDCGTPFCHTGHLVAGMASGCPINNLIPEWNDLISEVVGARPSTVSTRRTTSPSLPAGSAPRRARDRASSA